LPAEAFLTTGALAKVVAQAGGISHLNKAVQRELQVQKNFH
jgi:hypothetical protein